MSNLYDDWPADEDELAAHVASPAETVDELRRAICPHGHAWGECAVCREQWRVWHQRGSYEWLKRSQVEAEDAD